MVQNKSNRITPKDQKVIKLFSELGMPRNLAKTLMYISNSQECRSSEIERNARLRQPEVSVAMQELQRKGWIEKRDLKKKGKGRPVHIYKLTAPITDIVKDFEEEKTKEIDAIKKDLSDLRKVLESR